MRYFNRGEFEGFYKKYSEDKLKKMMDLVYDSLSNQFKHRPNLGEDGYRELLCAILLFKYDKLEEEKITMALCKLFQEEFDELDFSEYMDIVVEESKISIKEWIDLYDYMERNHKWIEKYRAT